MGHEYKGKTEIVIQNGRYICEKGNKLVVNERAVCMADIHYFEKNPKEPIPVDTVVKVNYCWANFEGRYINVEYKGKNYDVKPSYLRYDANVA